MPNETINNIASVFAVDAEAVKAKSKPHRSASIIKEFSLNTSTHGIPGIARSESIPNRVFWSVSLTIFTSIMAYFIIQSIRAYFAYPSQTTVSVITEWPQAFPALTICNQSPLRSDRFLKPFLDYTNALQLTNKTDTLNFTSAQASYIQDYLTYKLNRNESLDDYFYSLESMLMSCSYNGMSCMPANFTWFMSSRYGLCHTFNAKLKDSFNSTLRVNSDNGGNGLLELQLYVHQHQYVPYLSNGIGAVVLVHDNRQLPMIEMTAMQLAPGRNHKLGYAKKINYFLPAPYTLCKEEVTRGMQVMYEEYHNTDYGFLQLSCYSACIQAYTYQKCGCGNPFDWAARFVVMPGSDTAIHIPLCNVSNSCYGSAAAEIMNTQSIWTSFCPGCGQESPPAYLMETIKQFVESTKVPLPDTWNTTWKSEIQSSYVSLEVAYETSRTELYTQQPTLSPVDVISNVGGQTGLWIGISFLSLMEVAEMLYRLIRSQCYRFWRGMQTIRISHDSVL